MRSLCATPKRCSSSTTSRPRSRNSDALLEQAVRADHDVDRARRRAPRARASRLRGRLEARERLDPHRVALEALAERLLVLLAQDRGGHQHGDLLAVHRGAEGRAHGHLGLAVADVAADEPVHRLRALHVAEHVLDRGELVGRLLVGEGRLELLQAAGRAARTRSPARARAPRARRAARCAMSRSDVRDPRFALLPGVAAELVDARHVAVGAGVALHQVQPVHGHEQARAARRTRCAGTRPRRRAARARRGRGRRRSRARRARGSRPARAARAHSTAAPSGQRACAAPLLLARAEDLLLGDDARAARSGSAKPSESGATRISTRPGADQRQARPRLGLDRAPSTPYSREQRAQALGVRERAGREHDPPALRAPRRRSRRASGASARSLRSRARERARAARRGRRVRARSRSMPSAARRRRRAARGITGRRASDGALERVGRRARARSGGADQPPAAARERRSSRAPRRRSAAGARARRSRSSITTSVSSGRKSKHALECRAGAAARAPRRRAARARAAASRPARRRRARRHALRARPSARSAVGALDHERAVEQQLARRRRDHVAERRLASAGSPGRTRGSTRPRRRAARSRTGRARCGGKRSRMPPRTASSPRSSTSGMRA